MAQQTVNIPWKTGTGNIICKWDDADPSPTTVSIQSDTPNVSAKDARSQVLTFTTTSGNTSATVNVSQEASVYTYEFVPSASVETIAASGGDSVVTASLKTYRNGSLVSTKTINPSLEGTSEGFSISGNTVTAANRGIVQGEQRSISLTCTYVTSETGETLSETLVINQAANNRVIVYSKPNITDVSAEDIPASGGTVSSANVSYSQSRHYYYDSGETEELEPLTTGGTINYGDPVTAGSRGINIGDRQLAGTLTFTVSMNGQTSVEQDVSIYQEANEFIEFLLGDLSPTTVPSNQGVNIIIEPNGWSFTSGSYPINTGQDPDSYDITWLITGEQIDDPVGYEGMNNPEGAIDFLEVWFENSSGSSISTNVTVESKSTTYPQFSYSKVFPITVEPQQ